MMLRPVCLLLLLAMLLAWAPSLFAQEEGGVEMDETQAVDEFVTKATAPGVKAEGPRDTTPLGQRPLVSEHIWRKRTGRIFGFSLAASYAYWIEGKFGLGSNASYHEQVFILNPGIETEFTFRLKDWFAGVLHLDYMYHKGSTGVFNGIDSSFSSFSSFSFMIGGKVSLPISEFFEVKEGSALLKSNFYAKLLVGAIHMGEVIRERPHPDTTYWRESTLYGGSLAIGFELHLDERFSFFVEHAFDYHSNPDPAAALRPSNKADPFIYYVLQFGWVFYFD